MNHNGLYLQQRQYVNMQHQPASSSKDVGNSPVGGGRMGTNKKIVIRSRNVPIVQQQDSNINMNSQAPGQYQNMNNNSCRPNSYQQQRTQHQYQISNHQAQLSNTMQNYPTSDDVNHLIGLSQLDSYRHLFKPTQNGAPFQPMPLQSDVDMSNQVPIASIQNGVGTNRVDSMQTSQLANQSKQSQALQELHSESQDPLNTLVNQALLMPKLTQTSVTVQSGSRLTSQASTSNQTMVAISNTGLMQSLGFHDQSSTAPSNQSPLTQTSAIFRKPQIPQGVGIKRPTFGRKTSPYPGKSLPSAGKKLPSSGKNLPYSSSMLPSSGKKLPDTSPTSPQKPAFTQEFFELIQSPQVMLDDHEEEEESNEFWLCDPEIWKKDQERRNGRKSPERPELQQNLIHYPQIGLNDIVIPSVIPVMSNTAVVQRGSSVPISSHTSNTTNPTKNTRKLSKPRKASISSMHEPQTAKNILPQTESEDDALPQIISCYSLNPVTKANTPIAPSTASKSSEQLIASEKMKKYGCNLKTPLIKMISFPPDKSRKKNTPTKYIEIKTSPESVSGAKAKVLAEWKCETSSPQTHSRVRSHSTSPHCGSPLPSDITQQRSRHFSTDLDKKSPKKSSRSKSNKKKSSTSKVKGSKVKQSPQLDGSSLESWFRSAQSSSLDMHVVSPITLYRGQKPVSSYSKVGEPQIVFSKTLTLHRDTVTKSSHKTNSIPTTSAKVIKSSNGIVTIPSSLSENIIVTSPMVSTSTQSKTKMKRTSNANTKSMASRAKPPLPNVHNAKTPVICRALSTLTMSSVYCNSKGVYQIPIPSGTSSNNAVSAFDSNGNKLLIVQSTSQAISSVLDCSASSASQAQQSTQITKLSNSSSQNKVSVISSNISNCIDLSQDSPQPSDEPLDYSMRTLRKLDPNPANYVQDFALDLTIKKTEAPSITCSGAVTSVKRAVVLHPSIVQGPISKDVRHSGKKRSGELRLKIIKAIPTKAKLSIQEVPTSTTERKPISRDPVTAVKLGKCIEKLAPPSKIKLLKANSVIPSPNRATPDMSFTDTSSQESNTETVTNTSQSDESLVISGVGSLPSSSDEVVHDSKTSELASTNECLDSISITINKVVKAYTTGDDSLPLHDSNAVTLSISTTTTSETKAVIKTLTNADDKITSRDSNDVIMKRTTMATTQSTSTTSTNHKILEKQNSTVQAQNSAKVAPRISENFITHSRESNTVEVNTAKPDNTVETKSVSGSRVRHSGGIKLLKPIYKSNSNLEKFSIESTYSNALKKRLEYCSKDQIPDPIVDANNNEVPMSTVITGNKEGGLNDITQNSQEHTKSKVATIKDTKLSNIEEKENVNSYEENITAMSSDNQQSDTTTQIFGKNKISEEKTNLGKVFEGSNTNEEMVVPGKDTSFTISAGRKTVEDASVISTEAAHISVEGNTLNNHKGKSVAEDMIGDSKTIPTNEETKQADESVAVDAIVEKVKNSSIPPSIGNGELNKKSTGDEDSESVLVIDTHPAEEKVELSKCLNVEVSSPKSDSAVVVEINGIVEAAPVNQTPTNIPTSLKKPVLTVCLSPERIKKFKSLHKIRERQSDSNKSPKKTVTSTEKINFLPKNFLKNKFELTEENDFSSDWSEGELVIDENSNAGSIHSEEKATKSDKSEDSEGEFLVIGENSNAGSIHSEENAANLDKSKDNERELVIDENSNAGSIHSEEKAAQLDKRKDSKNAQESEDKRAEIDHSNVKTWPFKRKSTSEDGEIEVIISGDKSAKILTQNVSTGGCELELYSPALSDKAGDVLKLKMRQELKNVDKIVTDATEIVETDETINKELEEDGLDEFKDTLSPITSESDTFMSALKLRSRNSPKLSIQRLNSFEMRTNFSVTSNNTVINIRPESLEVIEAKRMKMSTMIDDVKYHDAEFVHPKSLVTSSNKSLTKSKKQDSNSPISPISSASESTTLSSESSPSKSNEISQKSALISQEHCEKSAAYSTSTAVRSESCVATSSPSTVTSSPPTSINVTSSLNNVASTSVTPPPLNSVKASPKISTSSDEKEITIDDFDIIETIPHRSQRHSESFEVEEACCDEYDNMYFNNTSAFDASPNVTPDLNFFTDATSKNEDSNSIANSTPKDDALEIEPIQNTVIDSKNHNNDTKVIESEAIVVNSATASENQMNSQNTESASQEESLPGMNLTTKKRRRKKRRLLHVKRRTKFNRTVTAPRKRPLARKQDNSNDVDKTDDVVTNVRHHSSLSQTSEVVISPSEEVTDVKQEALDLVKRKTPIKLGYNTHAHHAGPSDIKRKRRKLVKKDPTPEKTAFKRPSANHTLLSDSSSDETEELFQTMKLIKSPRSERTGSKSTTSTLSSNRNSTLNVVIKEEKIDSMEITPVTESLSRPMTSSLNDVSLTSSTASSQSVLSSPIKAKVSNTEIDTSPSFNSNNSNNFTYSTDQILTSIRQKMAQQKQTGDIVITTVRSLCDDTDASKLEDPSMSDVTGAEVVMNDVIQDCTVAGNSTESISMYGSSTSEDEQAAAVDLRSFVKTKIRKNEAGSLKVSKQGSHNKTSTPLTDKSIPTTQNDFKEMSTPVSTSLSQNQSTSSSTYSNANISLVISPRKTKSDHHRVKKRKTTRTTQEMPELRSDRHEKSNTSDSDINIFSKIPAITQKTSSKYERKVANTSSVVSDQEELLKDVVDEIIMSTSPTKPIKFCYKKPDNKMNEFDKRVAVDQSRKATKSLASTDPILQRISDEISQNKETYAPPHTNAHSLVPEIERQSEIPNVIDKSGSKVVNQTPPVPSPSKTRCETNQTSPITSFKPISTISAFIPTSSIRPTVKCSSASSIHRRKRNARMGNWRPKKMPTITKLSNIPLPYKEPDRLSKAEREQNIYLTMQKLLNMGLIFDQRPRGAPSPSVPMWSEGFGQAQRKTYTPPPTLSEDRIASHKQSARPVSPWSQITPPTLTLPRSSPSLGLVHKKRSSGTFLTSEGEVKRWYSRTNVKLKPCSVKVRKINIKSEARQ